MLKKLNYILDSRQKWQLLFLLITFILGSFLELLGVSAILPLVNVIMDADILQSGYYALLGQILAAADVRDFIIKYCVLLIALYIFKDLYLLFMYNLQFAFTYRNKACISNRMMKIYMQQDYLNLIDHNVTDLLRSLSADIDLCFALILALLNILCESFTALTLIIYLTVQSPQTMISLMIIMGAFVLVFTRFYRRRLAICGERFRTLYADKEKWLLQTFHGIKEIKVMGREEFFYRNYADTNYAFAEADRKQNLNQMLTRPMIEITCIGGLLSIIAVQIACGAPIAQYISVLSVFAMAAMRLLPSFNRIMSNISSVLASIPGLDALADDMRRANAMHRQLPAQTGAPVRLEHAVEVRGLTFTYPGKTRPVLQDVSLTIPKNSAVALIGASGSGKTTLADIILGLIQPQSGSVCVDGNSIFDNLDSWHKLVAYIPQNIYLIDDSIRANVAFGSEGEEISEERIWQALESAQLDTFVRSLEKGLDTMVGDQGVKLSGGQRQRIGIARALCHNPEVLVLDEATSALDSETETAVMEAINRLQGNKTILVIAHRLTTIRNCDTIYEIRNSGVTPLSHEALRARLRTKS
ncbi:ABC transporter ATP-binding protein [uncultured Gemmiger sp.]|uniref:ABC transporter ATP-binding protein n=1 Tax=uncultured Gemmiger sp. TaxID=1623490 RepID=UPI0025F59BFF|nr:ABC transporter ATP-binding protein [uncultured Gemmiger sp.]